MRDSRREILTEKYSVKMMNEKYVGYCADLAKMIAEHVGFSYEMKLVKDNKG